jgi:hypothetical protein
MSKWLWLYASACSVAVACASVTNDHGVHGLVVDAEGDPVPGLRVLVLGDMLRTDADGRFDSGPLTTPTYDLMLESSNNNLVLYAGMSSLQPTLRDPQSRATTAPSGQLTIVAPEDSTDTVRSTQFFTIEGGTGIEYWHNFNGWLRERHSRTAFARGLRGLGHARDRAAPWQLVGLVVSRCPRLNADACP